MTKKDLERINAKKVEWFDTLTELLNLDFDLDKNSARDLLAATNELLKINRELKKGAAQ